MGVYARAAYLDLPGGLVALTTPDVPVGPVHLRAAVAPDALRVGEPVLVAPGLVQAGPILLDLRTARLWEGPLPTPAALDGAVSLAVDLLAAAPPSSLPVPVPVRSVTTGDLCALAACLGGVGPGLTPAGDDCLAGILLVARTRWGDAAEPVLVEMAERVPTNDVARAFLAWAARGQSIQPVHEFLVRAAWGERDGAEGALTAVTAVGHSSGADLALGLRLGLEWLPSREPAGAVQAL